MDGCLFCKIVKGEIPSTKVFENERVYAFRDINPQAPVHILIIPKEHMANVLEAADGKSDIMSCITEAIATIAKQEGVDKTGFRIISNCGKDAAQSVEHLHFHLLGGKQMSEQMT